MRVDWTVEQLIEFEDDIAACFNAGSIKAPIHLSNGCEEQMIAVFRERVDEADWLLGSWRMHYACLLKGVPPERLKADILAGKSLGLCYPEFRILSSAIVGGVLPIAVGIALGIKRQGGTNKVICFLGDMSSETGGFHECVKYGNNHGLPLLWVVEDNDKSICTPTREVWGTDLLTHERLGRPLNVIHYYYRSKWPHYGTGKRVAFV